MTSPYHAGDIEEVLRSLGTSREGLSSEEAERQLSEFGYNKLVERERVTLLDIFLNQFKDIFIIMLLIATAISFLVGEIIDASTIAVIVILNSVVGFVQEYRSEKAMEAMKKLTAPKARVLRDGEERIIPAREVVPGDIAMLEEGDRIPADGRLVEVVELKTSEAVLTGESTPVGKTTEVVDEKSPVADRKNSVFMATHIIYGRGKVAITSTGMQTEFGQWPDLEGGTLSVNDYQ